MQHDLSRRHFIRTTVGAAAGLGVIKGAPAILHAQNKGDKLRVAFVGVGGIAGRHTGDVERMGDTCTAYCDVDSNRFENAAKRWPDAKGFQDYREMFDKEAKNFDAVMVGTPDHTHYPATVLALTHGKHVFTQKPLTHTVWESRQLAKAVEKYKVATQMGNQGHANEGNRLIYEYVNSGMLGDIKEVHCFTNRPIWPQGIDRPEGEDPIPASLNWDAWIGAAPMRPYKNDVYHPFKWRGWWDFGAGALGDMACHTMDSVFMALNPGYPTSVEALKVDGMTEEAFPNGSTIKWTFGKTDDRPGFDLYWYDGNNRPDRPKELPDDQELPESGNIYYGTKATLLVAGDYGDSPRIIPDEKRRELGRPPELLERSPGHHEEWRMACVGDKDYLYPGSNFTYAGPFTETILLGNVCLKFPNQKLDWDGPNLKFTNNSEANNWVTKPYREGWDFKLEL